jgi:hypothetical protein
MQSSSGCEKVNDAVYYREMQTRSLKSQFFSREDSSFRIPLLYSSYAYSTCQIHRRLFLKSLLNQRCQAEGQVVGNDQIGQLRGDVRRWAGQRDHCEELYLL